MLSTTSRWLSPDEQVEFLERIIQHARRTVSLPDHVATLRLMEADLTAIRAKRDRGEMEPVWYDPVLYPLVNAVVETAIRFLAPPGDDAVPEWPRE